MMIKYPRYWKKHRNSWKETEETTFSSMQYFDCLTHLSRMNFPIAISRTSLFPILGLLGGIFHFYLNFKRKFCKQTMENQIRRRVLRHLIWFCTVCQCPTKRMLGLYGLRVGTLRPCQQFFSHDGTFSCIKPVLLQSINFNITLAGNKVHSINPFKPSVLLWDISKQ